MIKLEGMKFHGLLDASSYSLYELWQSNCRPVEVLPEKAQGAQGRPGRAEILL